MSGIHAFTDEYGDVSLAVEKAGVTSFFIITAVLINDDLLPDQRRRANSIRQQFFGRGEMKSSGIGVNDERRIRVVSEIEAFEMTTYMLAIDKRELDQENSVAGSQLIGGLFGAHHPLDCRKRIKDGQKNEQSG